MPGTPEERCSDPLTPEQLERIVDVASDMGFRYRLLADVIPCTGLTFSEFCHLREDWRRKTGSGSDEYNIHIPLASPCAGTLRTKPSGREIEELDEPCWLCRDNGEWEPSGECRHRIIPVPGPARESLDLCFDDFGMSSLPFTVSSNFYEWMDDLADAADLSRTFGFKALRRTYGTILIRKGYSSGEVAKYLGLSERHKTKPLYEATGKPVDWEERPAHKLADQELIEALQRLDRRLDSRPTVADIEEHFEYSYKPLYEHFGGLSGAIEAANLDVSNRDPQAIPREELIGELQRLATELGHPPLTREMSEHGAYGRQVYQRRFDNWDAALDAAGLDPEEVPRHECRRISNDKLLGELRRLADVLERPPSRRDLSEHGRYSYPTYIDRFDGIREAREAAGVGHP